MAPPVTATSLVLPGASGKAQSITRSRHPTATCEAIGRRIRRLFREKSMAGGQGTVWRNRRRYPRSPWLHVRVLRQTLLCLHAVFCLVTTGRAVRRQFGRGLLRQAGDMLRLALQDGMDGKSYYMLELYRADGAQRARDSVTRYETKNGFFTALKAALPVPADGSGPRGPLGDKLRFHAHCSAHGIATAPVLRVIEQGRIQSPGLHHDQDLAFDLFVKPRRGKGARAAEALRFVGRDHDGISLYEDAVGRTRGLAEIAATFRETMLVQPRLANHPDIADLADQSLIVIRVITCLDRSRQPVVTHGMLRMLGKLEPRWSDPAEYGAPIDLVSGCLGELTADKLSLALAWHRHHPHTRTEVTGRLVPQWDTIANLARAAHAAFAHRIVLGWDIALTPDGPLLVEGNAHPDLAFLQRVHRAPLSASRLGPLLHEHLGYLEKRCAS